MKNDDILGAAFVTGRSPQVQALSALLDRVAAVDTPLLVAGEPGTYKEAFAEAVHRKSPRRHDPFLVVDCVGSPLESLEVELFGDDRDFMAGRGRSKEGIFEAAAGGTVFLGEVGELSVDLQSRVVRAIERKQIRRVGGTSIVSVNVRVIASTSRNPRTELEEHRFRADFYYRLTTVEVRLPPLRERLEDIPALVKSIVDDLGIAGSPDGAALLDPGFLSLLARYAWPGNMRQLRHHVERCLALGDVSLPPSMDTFPSVSGSYRIAKSVDSIKMLRVARKV